MSSRTHEPKGLTRAIVRWFVKRYYDRIEISGQDRVPSTGPALICANHANSLIDPVLIGVAAKRPVRFMAKAPLFDMPILGPVMHALGMVPAFRGSDDSKQVRKNLESLDVGAKVLVDGQAMGIFPEGKSTDAAHLEQVRSGAARMALQAYEEGAENLQVVPIGLTYEGKDQFRSDVWIQVGRPIQLAEWLNTQEGNDRQIRRALTEEIEARLKEVVVHLDNPDWEPWLNDLEILSVAPDTKAPVAALRQRKRLADAVNYYYEHDQPRTLDTANDIKSYTENVHAAGLALDSPVLRTHGLKVCAKLIWECLWLIFLFLPALKGWIHHLAPFVLVRNIARRIDQPGRKTTSTNRLMVGLPVYALWYGLVTWWMYDYFTAWFTWTWMVTAPFAGVIAVNYWRRSGKAARLLWHQLKVTFNRKRLKELRLQESQISEKLTVMTREYAELHPAEEVKSRRWKRTILGAAATAAIMLMLLFSVGWFAKYWFFDKPLMGQGLDLQSLPATKLAATLTADEKTMLHLIDGMERLKDDSRKIQTQFADGTRDFTKQQDNDDVRELMRRYLTYREALLRIIWKYQRYGDLKDDALRSRAFLVDLSAASVLYMASTEFIEQYEENASARAKLNEPEPNWGIPPGLYDTVRRNLASRKNLRMFSAARQYYHQDQIQALFAKHNLVSEEPYQQLHAAVDKGEEVVRRLSGTVPTTVINVAATDLKEKVKQLQYISQSAISTWIGDFKIRQPRDGKSLISPKMLKRLEPLLEPGDVLLERRNWYLSNAFLPGYWPHGAVYVGTAEDLEELGLHENEHIQKHWEEFCQTDADGHEHVIIEAISEGVVFSSLEHSIGGADSVAILRPVVSEQEKHESIARAFSFAGRPYDFEFDFETTSMLVCTEVVFRSYGGNSATIQFPLEEIMGRQTMPAINLVKKYDREFGTDQAQFEFIAFIDGNENTGKSRFTTDAQDFRDTLNRTGTTFLHGSRSEVLGSIGVLGWILLSLTIFSGLYPLLRRAVHRKN